MTELKSLKWFIENVKAEMARKRVTQAALAKDLKISQPALNITLSGKSPPGLERIEAISEAIKLPLSQLFTDPKEDFLVHTLHEARRDIRTQEALIAGWRLRKLDEEATRGELYAKDINREIEHFDRAIIKAEKILAAKKQVVDDIVQKFPEFRDDSNTDLLSPTVRSLIQANEFLTRAIRDQENRIRDMEAELAAPAAVDDPEANELLQLIKSIPDQGPERERLLSAIIKTSIQFDDAGLDLILGTIQGFDQRRRAREAAAATTASEKAALENASRLKKG